MSIAANQMLSFVNLGGHRIRMSAIDSWRTYTGIGGTEILELLLNGATLHISDTPTVINGYVLWLDNEYFLPEPT